MPYCNTAEAYSEPCQTSKIKQFCEKSQRLKVANIFAIFSNFDVSQVSEYISENINFKLYLRCNNFSFDVLILYYFHKMFID